MAEDLSPLREIHAERSERLLRLPNAVGTGVGYRRRAGKETDELCVVVSVERKLSKSDLRDDELVPPEVSVPGLGSAPTDVVEVGRLIPLEDVAMYRPLPGGCRIYGRAIPAHGTLGALAYDPNWGYHDIETHRYTDV